MSSVFRLISFGLLSGCLLVGTTACSFWSKKTPEAAVVAGKPLEVPPGLDAPVQDASLGLPALKRRLLPHHPEGRVVRDGCFRYLDVAMPPEKVWHSARAFFREQGFKLVSEAPEAGYFETDWREQGSDEDDSWFSALFKGAGKPIEQEKFRVRLERVADDDKRVRVFITQRRIVRQVLESDATSDYDEKRWVAAPPDPEREAVILKRFLAYLGAESGGAADAGTAASQRTPIEVGQQDGMPVLTVKENFARTWRRVGLALDRLGLVVDDRNRSQGRYFIRLGEDFLQHHSPKQGFFERLFQSEANAAEKRYIIRLQGRGEATRVMPLDENGKPLKDEIGKLLIERIREQLQ